MDRRRHDAHKARALLGAVGTLRRVASLATIYEREADVWVVESPDSSGDGGICTTTFDGPHARERATEYAQQKYSGFRIQRAEPERCS